MKRDVDLIRKLIFAFEERPAAGPCKVQFDGYTSEQVGYHSYLMIDGGLAKGLEIGTTSDTFPNRLITHLTSAGHDFADSARNETI